MQPTLASMVKSDAGEPNLEYLRSQGWQIGGIHGRYCVVWRGSEELVLVWRNDGWQRVGGGGSL